MNWLAPAMFAGLLAIAVPVLVHLVQRQLDRGRAFPSLMFLERIPYTSRRRRRLRDLPLLALRILALVALVLAFAGPVPEAPAPLPEAALDEETVVLLDVSFSMSSPGRWSAALAAAREAITAGAGAGRVALVAFDRGGTVLAPPATSAASALAALDTLTPGTAGTRYGPALRQAAAILSEGGARRQVLVLISDLQRSAMTGTARLPGSIELRIVPVTTPVGPNLSLLGGALGIPPGAARRPTVAERSFEVTVANTGSAAVTDVGLSLRVNGLPVGGPRRVSLLPGEQRDVSLPIVLSVDAPTRLEVALEADAMAADDRYFAVLAPHRPVRALQILDGPPERGAFLREALAIAAYPGASLRALALSELDADALEEADVLVLQDVMPPEGARRRAVLRFVEAGGGVLISAGPRSASRWMPAGDALLPGAEGVRRGGGGVRGGDGADAHALWTLAGAGPARLLRGVRVATALDLRPAPEDAVLARLDDGVPLLIERRLGAGRVIVLATTADPGWSTLVLEPGFIALTQALAVRLAGREPAPASVEVGAAVDPLDHLSNLGAPAVAWRRYLLDGGAVLIESPRGRALPAGGARFNAREPGLYSVHRRDGDHPPLPVAVNPEAAEARLEAAGEAQFLAWLQRPAGSASTGSDAAAPPDDVAAARIARLLLALAALLFVAETILSTWRRRRRAPGEPVRDVAETGVRA